MFLQFVYDGDQTTIKPRFVYIKSCNSLFGQHKHIQVSVRSSIMILVNGVLWEERMEREQGHVSFEALEVNVDRKRNE